MYFDHRRLVTRQRFDGILKRMHLTSRTVDPEQNRYLAMANVKHMIPGSRHIYIYIYIYIYIEREREREAVT